MRRRYKHCAAFSPRMFRLSFFESRFRQFSKYRRYFQTLRCPMINLPDFKRLDLRVGQIREAEPIPGARRLLKVQVDLGGEQRTLVAGLAGYYSPQQLIGLKVIVLANLEPAIIHGVRSQGMLLGAGCGDGQDIALLTTNKDVLNGT